jgi:hypothetical protein
VRLFTAELLLDGPGVQSAVPSNDAIVFRDFAFLTLIVSLTVVLYVPELGLYGDDYAFLAQFKSSKSSFTELLRSILPDTRARPVQSLYLAGLY